MKDRGPEIRHSGAHKQSLKISFKKFSEHEFPSLFKDQFSKNAEIPCSKIFHGTFKTQKLGFGVPNPSLKRSNILYTRIFFDCLVEKKFFKA